MENNVKLFMMPVCVCGHVFRRLKLVIENASPLNPDFAIGYLNKRIFFEPLCCPSCGRVIEAVQMKKDLKPNEDGEIIFIDEECRPSLS